MEITVDSATLKIVAGLLGTTLLSLITATVTLVRRYSRIQELEVAVLGDPALGRKGLRRVVIGDPEVGDNGLMGIPTNLVAVQQKVDRHDKILGHILRGFDVLDEDTVAEVVRSKVKR